MPGVAKKKLLRNQLKNHMPYTPEKNNALEKKPDENFATQGKNH